jgi:ABC-type multidrug transport system permease subunit
VIKTIHQSLTPIAVGLFLFYLIGSFISVSFNPVDWSIECRILTTVFGFIFGLMIEMKLKSSII